MGPVAVVVVVVQPTGVAGLADLAALAVHLMTNTAVTGRAPPGHDWPAALATGGCERRPVPTKLGGPPPPCRQRNCDKGSGRPTDIRRSGLHRRGGTAMSESTTAGPRPVEPGAAAEDATIRPFQVSFPDEDLVELRRRIDATRWPERETVDDDSQGVPLATMQELAR
jgi:hypothetical protein